MSLVGPRPEIPYFVEQFRETVPLYMVKCQVRPGMTGWAQIHGLRGDTSIPARVEHDLWYIENWSFGLDLKILFKTANRYTYRSGRAGRGKRTPPLEQTTNIRRAPWSLRITGAPCWSGASPPSSSRARPAMCSWSTTRPRTDGAVAGGAGGAGFPPAALSVGENLGGAGGFHTGMRLALEAGYEWLWIMDDDSLAAPTALEKLLAADRALAGEYGWLSSGRCGRTGRRAG